MTIGSAVTTAQRVVSWTTAVDTETILVIPLLLVVGTAKVLVFLLLSFCWALLLLPSTLPYGTLRACERKRCSPSGSVWEAARVAREAALLTGCAPGGKSVLLLPTGHFYQSWTMYYRENAYFVFACNVQYRCICAGEKEYAPRLDYVMQRTTILPIATNDK